MSGTSLRERRWLIPAVITMLFAVGGLAANAHAGGADNRKADVTINGAQAAPDELLVKFGPGLASEALAAIQANTGIQVLKARPFRLIDWYYVQVKSPRALADTIKAFAASPNVVAVEPNYTVHALVVPNDPYFGSLWGMTQIQAPDGWDVRTETDVVVAVIDTGVDYTHEDLADNMWVNSGEVPGDSFDNDHNGFVDDVYGWDFYDNDYDPMDEHSHGTHVAGTIGAVGNNATGVVGVCWGAKIMALRFLGPGGSGHTLDAIDAIEYATLNGAKVMNNSWGGGAYSLAMEEAIWVAHGFGILFVAAAGNSNSNNNATPTYPATYDVPNIISVAATGSDDALWVALPGFIGSNYGNATVHLAAPGVDIRSTIPDDEYDSFTGTSMATPHVSGACALVWAQYPALTHLELKDRILGTVDRPNVEEPVDDPNTVNPLKDLLITEGRLNLSKALSKLRIATVSLPVAPIGDYYSVVLKAAGGTLPYTWSFADGGRPDELAWLSINPSTGELYGSAPMPPAAVPGTYDLTMRVTDSTVPIQLAANRVFEFTLEAQAVLTVRSEPFSAVRIKGWHRGRTEYIHLFPRPPAASELAQLHAPENWAGQYFYEWRDQYGFHLTYDREIEFYVTDDVTWVAIYDPRMSFWVNDGTSEDGIGPGNDANPGTSPAAPKRNIQAMLDAIAAGGYNCHEYRLIVSAGTYQENIVLGPEHSGLVLQGLSWELAVIDAGGNGPCIWADRWADGTIMGFALTNGVGIEGGGAIHLANGSSVTIVRNHIYGNWADEGGAIAGYSCTALVKDNYIWSNGADDQGGAILFSESNPVVIEGNWIYNHSAYVGGGIRCWLSAGWITNNDVIMNTAESYGGGIYCAGYWMAVDQNVIAGNSALRGGGVFTYDCIAPLAYNTIVDNQAAAVGGGVSCEYFSDQPITGNDIWGNTATYGGGLYCFQSNPPEISGNSISWNEALESGGGIFLGPDINSPIVGNTIAGNTAGLDGGGIYLSPDSSPIIGLGGPGLTNNISSNDAGRSGGGIYIREGCNPMIGSPSLLFWGDYMSGNSAEQYGGGIYCGPGSSPSVFAVALIENSALKGGGVYCLDSAALFGNTTYPNDGYSAFWGNHASLFGGGLYIGGTEASQTFYFPILTDNAAEEGGGIYIDEGTTPSFGWASVDGNLADYGGGIRILAASPYLGVRAGWNQALVEGGGIYMTDGSDVVMGVHLIGNMAPVGSGLYSLDSFAELTTSVIEQHTCLASGAGIRALRSDLIMHDCVVKANAAPSGGGIFLDEGSTLAMDGCTIQSNDAVEGSGIYVAEAVATIQTIKAGQFNNVIEDTATRGAGIYCSADATVSISMARFGESHAEQGGGIYCASGSSPTIQNCLFVGNSGDMGSGLYCAAGGSPEIRNIAAIANSATSGGAGLHSDAPGLPVRNSIFWLNNEDLLGASPTYCCIQDVGGGTGNFSADPMMVGPAYTGTWGDPDWEDEDPVVVLWTAAGEPFTDGFCGVVCVPATTRFTAVGAVGVVANQFVGMWLNPNVKSNVQFVIVRNTATGDGHNGGTDFYVRGDASAHAEEEDHFQIWDYHLKSAGGHWTALGWMEDLVTSPCIDTGDPADAYSQEPEDNGDRINMGAYGNTYQASRSAPRVPYLLAESGIVWIDHNWQTVQLTEDFIDPVVVVGPATSIGWQPGVVRVRNVTNESFQLRFQEWNYLDGWHCLEAVQWIAVERGVFDLPAGGNLIAGSFSTNVTNVYAPYSVTFADPFLSVPVVVAQVMTYNGAGAVTDRICGVTATGMTFAMQEEEGSLDGGVHATETISYLAVTQGAKAIGNVACDVRSTAAIVTHLPTMLSSSRGSVLVRVREEQSKDAETLHWAAEKVGFIGIPGQPPVIADMQTCNGSDPCNLRVTLLAENFQFEHDVVSADSSWQTVDLTNVYRDPVVLVGPATYAGTDPGVERVRNVTSTSFDVRFQEWNYLDGSHTWEKMHYLVVERGAWQIDLGQLLVADERQTSNDNVYAPTTVYLPMPFGFAPVVVATQQTAAGSDGVTERLSSIGTATFAVALQEEEAGGGHVTETIGYVGTGSGTGGVPATGTLTVVPHSEDTVGGEVSLPGWRIFITEEQSKDSETTHAEETVGWFDFLGSIAELHFVADMQTTVGTDPATLRCAQFFMPASRSVGRPVALGLAGAPVSPSLSPTADCALDVAAADAAGRQLEVVQVVVDSGGRTTVQATPWVEECKAGDSVKLTAPDSIVENGTVLSFQQWEVDGKVSVAGMTTVSVEIAGRHRAVAVYVSVGPASGSE